MFLRSARPVAYNFLLNFARLRKFSYECVSYKATRGVFIFLFGLDLNPKKKSAWRASAVSDESCFYGGLSAWTFGGLKSKASHYTQRSTNLILRTVQVRCFRAQPSWTWGSIAYNLLSRRLSSGQMAVFTRAWTAIDSFAQTAPLRSMIKMR